MATDAIDYGHWDVTRVGPFQPSDWFGFIYEIEHRSSGKRYIGRKQFLAKRQKTKTKMSRMKDSKWRAYTSSSDLLNQLISTEGPDAFIFRILKLCSGKCELNYEEESIQREKDVLRARLPNGELAFYNRTIGYKNFAGLSTQTEESKRKVAEARTRYFSSPENRAKQSLATKGIPKSEEGRRNIALAATGKTQSQATREKRRQAMHQLRWWTDGTKNVRLAECPGEGWRPGRFSRRKQALLLEQTHG